MPVTKVQSGWDSGNLIFHESLSKAPNALYNVLTIGTTGITVGSATNDVDFKIFLGASDQYALFDCGLATLTLAKLDVTLTGDLTIDTEDINLGDTDDLEFGDAQDTVMRWHTGDATNHTFVVGLDNTGQQMHITDKAVAQATTDWNRTAGTHPEVAIHSNTTPITDYLAIGNHDGTTAHIDVMGGTTLSLDIAGTAEVVVAAASTSPATTDSNALGTTSLMWSDLFLASAGVINFNAGNCLITHAAGVLTVTGDIVASNAAGPAFEDEGATTTNPTLCPNKADLTTGIGWNTAEIHFVVSGVDEVNLSATALSPGVTDSTALGTTALMWSDLFLASGAVINFNDGNVTITHSAALLTLGSGGLSVGADGAGFDVIFYGDRTGSDFFWDQDGQTNGSLNLGTTTVSEGADFFAHGDTASNYLHWDCSADDLLLVGTATQFEVAGTTDASSAATGSIHTAGGLGVGMKAYIGGELVLVAGPLDMTTAAEDIEVIANTAAALEFYDATTKFLVFDTRNTVTAITNMLFTAMPSTIVAASGIYKRTVGITPGTTTLTGSTGVTAMEGLGMYVAQPTVTDEDAVTITDASTVYIANAPTGAGSGPATLTNAYALKVAAGATSIGGVLSVGGVATFSAQDIHSLGLTVADAKAAIQGMNTFAKLTPTILTSGSGYTMSAAQMLSGLISDTSASGGIAATLPTVADVVALIGGYVVGTSFYLDYSNPGNQTVTITQDASAQWTLTGTMTIATTTHRRLLCRIDSATSGTVYSLGDAAQ